MTSEHVLGDSQKRLLIVSDIHGSIKCATFLKECIDKHKPDVFVLLGDYLAYQYSPHQDTLSDIIDVYEQYNLPIITIRGNCDHENDCDILPFTLQDSAWIYTDNLSIFACHGHNIPYCPKGTVILAGHTHVPQAQTIAGKHYWNPGSIAFPRNGTAPSYGMYEDGTFSVIHVNGTILMQHTPSKS